MQKEIARGIREALEARRKAEACIDTKTQDQWLNLAAIWEQYVRACEDVQKTRDSALAAEVVLKASGAKTRRGRIQ